MVNQQQKNTTSKNEIIMANIINNINQLINKQEQQQEQQPLLFIHKALYTKYWIHQNQIININNKTYKIIDIHQETTNIIVKDINNNQITTLNNIKQFNTLNTSLGYIIHK